MHFSVREQFNNKNVLITGTTGFIGKVILERILRLLPSVAKIYILVRPKNSQTLQQRLESILNSPIMNTTVKQMANGSKDLFRFLCEEKIVLVEGDISEEQIFVNEEQKKELQQQIHFIIHCAATVDFDERLDRAIRLNVYGSVALMRFAHSCHNMQAFIHTSTCYVHSNKSHGELVKEVLPDLKLPGTGVRSVVEEITAFCKRLTGPNISEEQIQNITKEYLSATDYPNTYTFTKAMTEILIYHMKGNLPVAFVRPSIVGAALKEPFVGWVEGFSAASAIVLLGALGMLRVFKGSNSLLMDEIPVDLVANTILVATAKLSAHKKFAIYNSATTSLNKCTFGELRDTAWNYFDQNRPKRGIAPPEFTLYPNPLVFKFHYHRHYTLPKTMACLYSYLVPTSANINLARKAAMLQNTATKIIYLFERFTNREWIFDSSNVVELSSSQFLSEEERRTFYTDAKEIEWRSYLTNYCKGLAKYILKEDVVGFNEDGDNNTILLSKL